MIFLLVVAVAAFALSKANSTATLFSSGTIASASRAGGQDTSFYPSPTPGRPENAGPHWLGGSFQLINPPQPLKPAPIYTIVTTSGTPAPVTEPAPGGGKVILN